MAEGFDRITETAKRVFEVIKPLHRWEQEITLEVANSMRAHYWVTMSDDGARLSRPDASLTPEKDNPLSV